MRGSADKTTYRMSGTYFESNSGDGFYTSIALLLNSQDNGTSWLAYPGQTPILDCQKTVNLGIKIDGADNITILYREDPLNSPVTDADVKELGIDGLNIVYNASLHRLRGEADNLVELDVIDTQTREISTLAAQSLVIAAGRFPELIFVESKPVEHSGEEAADQPLRWEAFAPYKQPAFKDEVGLFARGDVLADYSAAPAPIYHG